MREKGNKNEKNERRMKVIYEEGAQLVGGWSRLKGPSS